MTTGVGAVTTGTTGGGVVTTGGGAGGGTFSAFCTYSALKLIDFNASVAELINFHGAIGLPLLEKDLPVHLTTSVEGKHLSDTSPSLSDGSFIGFGPGFGVSPLTGSGSPSTPLNTASAAPPTGFQLSVIGEIMVYSMHSHVTVPP